MKTLFKLLNLPSFAASFTSHFSSHIDPNSPFKVYMSILSHFYSHVPVQSGTLKIREVYYPCTRLSTEAHGKVEPHTTKCNYCMQFHKIVDSTYPDRNVLINFLSFWVVQVLGPVISF